MSSNKRIGEVRPSQMITTFGPGSIIDARNDCVTVLDTNYWKDNGKTINDPRFASYMGVNVFKVPPTGDDFKSEDIPVVSFPNYHICSNPKCSRVFKLDIVDVDAYKKFGPRCPDCNWPAYPSRFVSICPNGHLDDFDYDYLVHKGKKCDGKLRMYSTGQTSSLGDMIVKCDTCEEKKSLSGITSEANKFPCTGRHPFKPQLRFENCSCQMKAVQRGASNVYFPVIKSAISIPPYTDRLYMLIDQHYKTLLDFRAYNIPNPEQLVYNQNFTDVCTYNEFITALRKKEENIKDYVAIKESEYKAIINHDDPLNKKSPLIFKAEEDLISPVLAPYFSRIIRVTRIREIMCLKGFTRLDAPDPESEDQQNIVKLNTSNGWLPAVQINGEGIFIEFKAETLESWLQKNVKLDKIIKKEYSKYCEERGWTKVIDKGAIYMLMHTFSHLLIKEMGNKSGYSTAAIKERIYFGENMHGILLYTGSSDKEGSLGGLVELGNQDKLIQIIKSSFDNALLCTNDPDCMLSSIDSNLNISACHSCCMISETACENGNRMLDRGMIVPMPNRTETSYFKELVKEMCGIE